ncbi:MAG: hypothetical protein VX672_09455 [Planctomycetota bacterium]|nr:hypothetical protein [Planctomycetota bacterium]
MNRISTNIVSRLLVATLGLSAVTGAAASPQDFGEDDGFDPGAEVLDLEGVTADDFDVFSIQVQDIEIAQVLQMLALQSERNVIASRNVSALISANLFDVTFYEALDAILKPNGFRWIEEGKFIYVYTQDEFARMQALDRRTESRMFELEHLSAGDASEFATPLLSERGKLSFIGEVEGGIEQDLSNMGGDDWAKSAILVVNDYPEQLERIAELLEEIDTAPRQVVVDATIASVQVSESDAFGVDFALIGNLDVTKLIDPLGPVTDLLRGNRNATEDAILDQVPSPVYGTSPGVGPSYGVQSNPGNVRTGPANMKLGLVAGDAAVFIRALDTVTDTMVLARPRLMALNRQRAQVLVGERVAYLSTTSTDTTTTQTVQYLDTGVRLMLRPFISKDDSIRMELYPSVSNAVLRPVTSGQVAGQLLVPDEFTNEISTNVKVADGQTLVLGGLFQETTRVTNSQVPFLGDIPLLGAAFSGHDNDVTRREIIFLITPNIVEDSLIESSGRAGKAFVDSLRAGMREGLLPFSREKMSSRHNQAAFEAKQAGDSDKALYHLDNSLRLNPAQPGVRQLRAELTGSDSGAFYDYDIWNRIMQTQMRELEEQKSESARLDSVVDPLAETGSTGPATAVRTSREERFVEQLVEDLELPFADLRSETTMEREDAIVMVEAEPSTIAAAFGSEETLSADDGVVVEEPEATVALDSTDSRPAEVETTLIETTVASEPSPFTTEDALRIAGDTQERLVGGPELTGWGRLWWLVRMARDQSRIFSPISGSTSESAIATVEVE